MKRILLLLISILILFANLLPAQSNSKKKKTHYNVYDFDELIFWDDFYNPWIEINYGLGELKLENFNEQFRNPGNLQLKLGHSTTESYDARIIQSEQNFISFGAYSDRLKNSNNNNHVRTDAWQFGFGNRFGYGYSFGHVSIVPYNQRSMNWTKLVVTDNLYDDLIFNPEILIDPNSFSYDPFANKLNRFNETFRFGISAEGGINIQFGELISVGAGYELNTVYPRLVFWKASGSLIIEEIAQGFISGFVDQILDKSPAGGPIVNFLLKNGLSFAYYSLTRSDMNWPFPSETPLTYQTFKINMSFTF